MRLDGINGINDYEKIQKRRRRASNLVTSSVAVGTVLYMAKKGKLNPKDGGNKYIEELKRTLKTPADFILGKAAQIKNSLISKNVTKNVIAKTQEVKQKTSAFGFDRVAYYVDTLKDFAEKKINPEKFL